jgi:DNA-binding transcriptional ArsR family regulator
VLKHLAVLRDARLIETLPQGRRRRHYVNVSELDAVAEWLSSLRERSDRRP